MKRVISILLVLTFIFCLGSCDSGNEGLVIVDEAGESTQRVNPKALGTVTIVNFWGVWCPYCIYEMPYLNKIASDYKGQVSVVAVHTYSRKDEAPTFIMENYKNSEIIFAVDTEEEGYYAEMGGYMYYPYTVILNKDGEIVNTINGATNYDGFVKAFENYLE
ncbi:MAG: TlpA family protein disulfide reductase [Clostridia bacterium]|nr:TlpA family protein disulfide reductase [Clostridia bacterium]